jgi:predicted transposase YbfD/YdcC
LAAYQPLEGIVLTQMAAGVKDNEIGVAPTLLQSIDLHNAVVLGDALHTQRAVSAQICQAGGDFIWLVKENQPSVHADIAELFAPATPTVLGGMVPTDFRTARTVDKGHGRRDTRQITVSGALTGYTAWPHLAQVFQIERERTDLTTHHTTREVVYGITSLSSRSASPRQILADVRRYWAIENGLHRVRDVTFHEDAGRLTCGNAGRIMATVNNLAISLMRSVGQTNLARARRIYSTHVDQSLHLLTAHPSRL